MIGRSSAHAIADVFAHVFYKYHKASGKRRDYRSVNTVALYDFLYLNDYDAWFCNMARALRGYTDTRPLKEFIMRLHTGEALYQATPDWTWEQRQRLGQRYLVDLARDVLNHWHAHSAEHRGAEASVSALLGSLELDGYVYGNASLLIPEADALDAQEESGVLQSLYVSLQLGDRETVMHHLQLSEDHYLAKRWDDSIANSRKFLECVLQEVAAAHAARVKGSQLAEDTYTRPARVRDYLEREGLVETKEKAALTAVYGLLSHTGGHPYMAERDQARLLRHLALTFSQFALLRLKGSLA